MQDTQTITFREDIFENHPNCFNGWSEDYAQLIIKEALKELNYKGEIDEVIFSKYTCQKLDESNRYSEVCYMAANQIGFFFIMRDMVDHINVVFNRWD